MGSIIIKRVYDAPEESDGYRILTDRLWPRGIKKENVKADLWAKDITPSNELRKEFHQNLDFEVFNKKYLKEIADNPKAPEFRELAIEKLSKGNITLLTASKNMDFNQCHVLKNWIENKPE